MRVGLHLVGQASKRGLVPRQPSPERLVADLEAAFRAEVDEARSPVSRMDAPDGLAAALRVACHPGVDPVEIGIAAGGRIEVEASTAPAGPGYHTWLCHVLRRIGTDLSIDWLAPDVEPLSSDDSGYFWSDNRPDVERAHLVWLRAQLADAADPRRLAIDPLHLGSFDGHRYEADGAIVSSQGPRSRDWLAEALDRPSLATDVWPWAADAQDARYLLNRARALLWTEVRWRPAATDQEHAVLDEVARLLRRAFPLDPSLAYPWREWREVLQYAGLGTDPMTERIMREADIADVGDEPRIGYRRRSVQVEHAGWLLAVPGSWAERRSADEWWGGEGGRSVTLAGVETGEGGEPMAAGAFLDRVAGHLQTDALEHREGGVLARARIAVDSSSGIEVATLEGYSAVVGRGAAMKIEIHDPTDWEWALDMWRSLAPAR